MTRLALVRHGETDWNRVHRIQGRTDVPLNETGREQARRTARGLAAESWDSVYASPLSRAFETAEIIAHELGLAPPVAEQALIERNYGEAEGLTRADLDSRFPGATPVPGRERRSDAAARALPTLAQIARRRPDGRVLVVTHGGLIRSVLMSLEPEDGAHHTEPIANGSVHVLDYAEERFSLVAFNQQLPVPEDDEDINAQNAIEERESSRA